MRREFGGVCMMGGVAVYEGGCVGTRVGARTTKLTGRKGKEDAKQPNPSTKQNNSKSDTTDNPNEANEKKGRRNRNRPPNRLNERGWFALLSFGGGWCFIFMSAETAAFDNLASAPPKAASYTHCPTSNPGRKAMHVRHPASIVQNSRGTDWNRNDPCVESTTTRCIEDDIA